jgi:hypothetical protein
LLTWKEFYQYLLPTDVKLLTMFTWGQQSSGSRAIQPISSSLAITTHREAESGKQRNFLWQYANVHSMYRTSISKRNIRTAGPELSLKKFLNYLLSYNGEKTSPGNQVYLIAQWVEPCSGNLQICGSNPSRGDLIFMCFLYECTSEEATYNIFIFRHRHLLVSFLHIGLTSWRRNVNEYYKVILFPELYRECIMKCSRDKSFIKCLSFIYVYQFLTYTHRNFLRSPNLADVVSLRVSE